MEFIKNIEIKNFKSIRHQNIDGCKRINVFVGYPNVGKSNILEALSLFCIEHSGIKFKDLIRVKEDPTLFFNGFVTNTIEVTLNNYFQVYCVYNNAQLRVIEKELINLGNGRTPTTNEIILREFEKISKVPHDTISSRIEIKKYEFKKSVQPETTQYSYLEMPFGKNIFNILQTNETLYEDVSSLFKNYDLELVYDSALQAFKILKRTNKGIFTVPYEMIADTLQRLVFHKAAILSNNETVLLMEEPEVHMFPPYISKFTSDIWYNKGNQFFLTTHSPFILNDFLENSRDELSVFVVGFTNGETIIKRLSDEQLGEAYQYGLDLFFNLESIVE